MTTIYIGFLFTRKLTGTMVKVVAKYDYLADSERIKSDLEYNVNKLGPGWYGETVQISEESFLLFSSEGRVL